MFSFNHFLSLVYNVQNQTKKNVTVLIKLFALVEFSKLHNATAPHCHGWNKYTIFLTEDQLFNHVFHILTH